jgi:hypothetical protein
MKNKFLIIAFLFISQMNWAQDATLKANIIRLIEMSGADAQMKVLKPEILKMIPEDKKENFSKEFDASMPSLYDKIVKVYMGMYSEEDINAMIKFYESPIGKKMSQNAGELAQKSLVAGQEWGQELQALMMKYK